MLGPEDFDEFLRFMDSELDATQKEWLLVARHRKHSGEDPDRWGTRMCRLARLFMTIGAGNQTGADEEEAAAAELSASYDAVCHVLKDYKQGSRRRGGNERADGYAIGTIQKEFTDLRWFLGQLSHVHRTDNRQPWPRIYKNDDDVRQSRFVLEWMPITDTSILNDPYRDPPERKSIGGRLHSVTVMRINPAFSSNLDPYEPGNAELCGQMLSPLSHLAAQSVKQHDGRLLNVYGEFVAIFENPTNAGQAVELALDAAIQIRDQVRMGTVSTSSGPARDIGVRIGIHSQMAWSDTTSGESGEEILYTSAVCVADELQRATAKNTISISDSSFDQVRHRFNGDEVREITLPMRLHATVKQIAVLDRKSGSRKAPKLIGRTTELARLRSWWANNATRSIRLSGEPGIGKSRLARAFAQEVTENTSDNVIDSKCHLHKLTVLCHRTRQAQPLYPILVSLSQMFVEYDVDAVSGVKLGLKAGGVEVEGWAEWKDVADAVRAIRAGAAIESEDLLNATRRLLLELAAASETLLLIVEDVQWADESTRELLKQIVHDDVFSNVRIVETFTPAPGSELLDGDTANINVRPLDHDDVSTLARTLATIKLPQSVEPPERDTYIEYIVRNVAMCAGGNPRRAGIEVIREVHGIQEAKHDGGLQLERPYNHGAAYFSGRYLDAVLGYENHVRDVMATAVLLGFRFPKELLQATLNELGHHHLDDGDFESVLRFLVENECLRASAEGVYEFFDDLKLQGARELFGNEFDPESNAAVARAYESLGPDHPVFRDEHVAMRFTAAGSDYLLDAIKHWHSAGRRQLEASPPNLAASLACLNVAESLLLRGKFDDAPQLRLDLLIDMIVPLMGQSYGSERLAAVMDELEQNHSQIVGVEKRFRFARAAWSIAHNQNRLKDALAKAKELLKLATSKEAEELQHTMRAEAHHAKAVTYYAMGKFDRSLKHQEMTVKLWNDEPSCSASYSKFADHGPGPCCAAMSASTLWYLGESGAQQRAEEALEMLKDYHESLNENPPITNYVVMCWIAQYHLLAAEYEKAIEFAADVEQNATQSRRWRAMAKILTAYCHAKTGARTAGASRQIERGFNDWQRNGEKTYSTFFNALYAETLLKEGDRPKAKRALQRTIDESAVDGERFFLSENYRQLADILELEGDLNRSNDMRDQARTLTESVALLERCKP